MRQKSNKLVPSEGAHLQGTSKSYIDGQLAHWLQPSQHAVADNAIFGHHPPRNVENAENTENSVENAENMENADNAKNAENTDNAENTKMQKTRKMQQKQIRPLKINCMFIVYELDFLPFPQR